MYKESQFSIHDYLLELRPDLYKTINDHREKIVSKDSAKMLFSIWSDTDNKITSKAYSKPLDLTESDLERLQKEGLVQNHQGRILITSKGSEVIKTMVLGDDRSCFEDDGTIVDYKVAKAKTESPTRLRKQGKSQEDNFWNNLLK